MRRRASADHPDVVVTVFNFSEEKFEYTEGQNLLIVQEVADLLRVSNQTVKDERLSASTVGKEWRFVKDEVYEAMRGSNPIFVAARGGSLYDKDREYVEKVIENEEFCFILGEEHMRIAIILPEQ